MIPTIFEMLP